MSKRNRHSSRDTSNSGGSDHWTANDVRAILHNPVYVGLGPFPALIDEATWLAVQERMMREDGLDVSLLQLRTSLEHTFGTLPAFMRDPHWVADAKTACTRDGMRAYLTQLLSDLRAAYAGA
jgi:hypothetical protein